MVKIIINNNIIHYKFGIVMEGTKFFITAGPNLSRVLHLAKKIAIYFYLSLRIPMYIPLVHNEIICFNITKEIYT